jgi:hypothetical protein
VSGVTRLRACIGHAATSLRVIGFLTSIDALVLSISVGLPVAVGLLVALGVLWFARVVSKGLRAGTSWAMRAAAIWLALSAATTLFNAMPKALRAGMTGFSVLGMIIFIAPLFFLARGLFEDYRWRTTEGRSTRNAGPLAQHPWEHGRRAGATRPRFLNKRSVLAYVFLVLTPIPWILFALSSVNRPEMPGDAAERAGRYTAIILMHLLVWLWMVRIYRGARRHAMLRAREVVRADPRATVLYLRSFKDDGAIRVRARATDGRTLPERLVRVPFEEVITDHLWSYGPVVAIGDPAHEHERVPLGAARDFATDSEWQAKVADLMRTASMVVATLGLTEGFLWEIDRVLHDGLRSKLILLVPPVRDRQARERWDLVKSRVASPLLPRDLEIDGVRALVFPGDVPTVIRDRTRNAWTYETVLDAAVLALEQARQRSASLPASEHSGR